MGFTPCFWKIPWVSGKDFFLDENQQPDDVINEGGGFTNQFWLDSKVYLRKFLEGQFVI